MTSESFPELLGSFDRMREALQSRLAGIERYRAIQALEKTIAEFPDLNELIQPLSEIRERMQQRLQETREYRAILSVERIVPELSAVLDVLSETAAVNSGDADEQSAGEAAAEEDAGHAGDSCETVQSAQAAAFADSHSAEISGVRDSGLVASASGTPDARDFVGAGPHGAHGEEADGLPPGVVATAPDFSPERQAAGSSDGPSLSLADFLAPADSGDEDDAHPAPRYRGPDHDHADAPETLVHAAHEGRAA